MMNNTVTKAANKKVDIFSVRGITVMALLAAFSVILMLFEIPLWFAPSFYKIDLSEIPIMIGAFTLGPVAGIVIEIVKVLINFILKGTQTAGIGDVANVIIGCSFVVPSAILYQMKKTRKSAIVGMSVGTIILVIVGCLLNAYVLLPTYATAFHMPIDSLVQMGTAVNPSINSLSTFILFAVAPFNILKGVLDSLITIIIYKKVSFIIKDFHFTR
ncbi:MAG TPA: ECF transporter S component [Mobilitalea sp.]|nr:ECF transporter S component [Mobilitalea sp.]